jgi:UDP-N-acetylglucosamine transferase subunit ALG13
MIFLTVGTQFSFDRLVKAVDKAIGQNGFEERIFAQIGDSSYRPLNFEAVSYLEKRVFDNCILKASGIISHAGMGTIMMALENHKPLLVMPRLRKYGEVVNNHQTAIARKFEELGHILVAYTENDLPSKIERLKTFVPQPRKNQAKAVADRIARFLEVLSEKQTSD